MLKPRSASAELIAIVFKIFFTFCMFIIIFVTLLEENKTESCVHFAIFNILFKILLNAFFINGKKRKVENLCTNTNQGFSKNEDEMYVLEQVNRRNIAKKKRVVPTTDSDTVMNSTRVKL